MKTALRTITRFVAPLAVGAVIYTGSASAQELKIEELKDYCGEINQIVDDAIGYLKVNQVEILGRYRTTCPKLAYGLTYAALTSAKVDGIGAKVLKDIKTAIKEIAEAVGLPGEIELEKAGEKVVEKVIDASTKKAKEEFKKKLKDYFDNHPKIYKYTTKGDALGCEFNMTITWDTKAQSFLIRTTGDCKCKEITTAGVTGKIGKWQSNVKGDVVVNSKVGVGNLVIGLNVDTQSYSGAGNCDCDPPKATKNKINYKVNNNVNYAQPQVDGLALAITAITIGTDIARMRHGGHDFGRHHDHGGRIGDGFGGRGIGLFR